MYQIENYIFAMNSLLNPTFHFQMISNYFLLQIWYNIISYFRWCQIVAFPESYREYFTRPVVLSLILAIWVLRCCPFQQKNTEKFENTENILKILAIWVLGATVNYNNKNVQKRLTKQYTFFPAL